MDYQSGHVITLANSIIGVSILAMPYCFKQCGIILSIVILLISSIISRLSCHFLLKSAIISRRKTFEVLAFHIFGSLGKLAIEIGMIGLLLGTCVAFFVVMGDLGPEIISEIAEVRPANTTRTTIMILLTIFCVLPLGLLRNIHSLDAVSKVTIGFYCCLVVKVIIEAMPHLFTSDWLFSVNLWRPAGILQCLPIFSMALFCQAQLFEIYQDIPNISLEKMNNLIRVAVNICTCVYIFVGTFGYIAFFQKPFTGNILLSFKTSLMTDALKIGFILSLAFSFPLIIFPCRASLYSLLYKQTLYTVHEGTTNYISEGKFKSLTFLIVFVSLIIGILIPNIELVLGLVGSTIGVMICVLFPVTCFICISPKNTNERILAQIMLFIGVIVMVLATYANLYAFEEAKLNIITTEKLKFHKNIEKVNIQIQDAEKSLLKPDLQQSDKIPDNKVPKKNLIQKQMIDKSIEQPIQKVKEIRHEPPQPEEPNDKSKKDDLNEVKEIINNNLKEDVKQIVIVKKDKKLTTITKTKTTKTTKTTTTTTTTTTIPTKKSLKKIKKIDKKKNDEVDIEAIKKEESELKEQEKEHVNNEINKNKILLDALQKNNEVFINEQKKIIQVIEKQHNNIVREEKLRAVQQIENFAKKAIETISGNDKNDLININKLSNDIKDGQIKNNVNKPNEINLVPLPLARNNNYTNYDNEKSKNNESFILIKKEIIKTSTNMTNNKNKTEIKNKKNSEINNNQNIKDNIVGRDILSEKRIKRKVYNNNNNNNNVNVCDDFKKVTDRSPNMKIVK